MDTTLTEMELAFATAVDMVESDAQPMRTDWSAQDASDAAWLATFEVTCDCRIYYPETALRGAA